MQVTDGVATFPNGLKLRLTPEQISKQAIWEAARRHSDPQPPQVYITSKGEYEENPDDPDYRAALEMASDRRAFASVKALLVMGTELEAAPEGLPGPEATNWRKFAAIRDQPEPVNEFDRYDLWLRYYAFGYKLAATVGLDEFRQLAEYISIASGLTMEGVSSVVATFRDQPGRGADQPGDAMAAAANGDGDRPAAAGDTGPGD